MATAASRHPLERLLAPHEPMAPADPTWGSPPAAWPSVRCLRGGGSAQWLEAPGWRAFAHPSPVRVEGRPIETFQLSGGGEVSCRLGPDGTVIVPFSLAEAYESLTRELYVGAAGHRRLPPQVLNAFYACKRAIPRRLQVSARRALIRWQGDPDFPKWPMDASVSSLLRFWIRCELIATQRRELGFRWFWPDAARAAVILTHDVESAAGLRNAPRIADLEEERGLRSSFNLVAAEYPIDWGIVRELDARGFELGVHGVFHDRSMFASRSQFDSQQRALAAMVERLSAEGFRSPATHRVHDWLAELPVSYDCTVPLSDPYEPQPGGCCSPWPYFAGPLVELPWTIPQDNTTFNLLGQSSIDLWIEQVEALERSNGLVQCISHPDPGYLGTARHEALYEEFLDAITARPGLWRALPREVAAWWRRRDEGSDPALGTGIARIEAGSVVLEPPDRPQYESQPVRSDRRAGATR